MISKKQIQIIHVAVSKLGLEDWMYRELLLKNAGVKTSTSPQMDKDGFMRLMHEFDKLGFVSKKRGMQMGYKKPMVGNVPGGASLAQVEFLQNLWSNITDHPRPSQDFKKTLYTWLWKHFTTLREWNDHLEMLNNLDPKTAYQAIKYLKGMRDGSN